MSIATSILMKQYGILFSVFLGLHLLKKKYREFPKFFFGHLIIAIPIVGVVAYFNLQGLIDHALLYHLDRPPSGYSFTSIILYSLRIVIRQKYSSTLSILIGNIIIEIFQALLIFSLIYVAINMWQSKNEMSDLIKYLMYAHLCFYFLNNVLWIQYFIIFLVLWSEYLRATKREIKMVSIYWGYACIPMAVVIRAKLYTIPNVVQLLGDHWFTIIWIIGVSTHYIMFFYYHKRKTSMYEFWYAKLLHILMTILLPFQYYLMVNFAKTKSELFP